MRVLIFSDSHGDTRKLREALLRHSDITTVFHLGDGNRELEAAKDAFPDRTFYAVAGNCDFCCDAPTARIENISGKKVLCAHGHTFGVKGGVYTYHLTALERGAQLALFGHTHIPYAEYADGVHLFNPGSLREGRYGIADISTAGIVTRHMQL